MSTDSTPPRKRIPARPTLYQGVQMRSRLEATFAGLLDAYELPWQYEPQAFASGQVQYLPDFRVVSGGREWFIEVKPYIEPGAIERMMVILESIPDANLAVACPKFGALLAIYEPAAGAGLGLLGTPGIGRLAPHHNLATVAQLLEFGLEYQGWGW